MSLNEDGTLYTAKEVSDMTGVKPGSVAKFAKRHGIGRVHSGVYWFTDKDITYMKTRRRHGKVGTNARR